MKRQYGGSPIVCGKFQLPFVEYMHYLYLPIWMPGSVDWALPPRLEFVRPLLEVISDWEIDERKYVYLTARRGFASPGNPLNRPGWHSDGFGSDDVNYIWSDRFPTLFAEQKFHDISDDHVRSAEQFEEQVSPASIVTYENGVLLRLDPSIIHAAPEIPAPGGERSFIKISLSDQQYNLLGNSHNYLLDYDWPMFSRDEIRNDPAYAGGDAGPQPEAEKCLTCGRPSMLGFSCSSIDGEHTFASEVDYA